MSPSRAALLARSPSLLVAIALALFASGCTFDQMHHRSHPYERTVELAIAPDAANRFTFAGDLADVVVTGGAVQPHAVVVVREKSPDAGRVWIASPEEDAAKGAAHLRYESLTGDDDGFIDRVELWLPREVDALTITTALGDVEITDLVLAEDLAVLVDLGDVTLARVVAAHAIGVQTELGDLHLEDLRGPLRASTELGDVHLERYAGATATVTTELGDLTLIDCDVAGPFEYGTELGDTTVRGLNAPAPVEEPRSGTDSPIL